MASSGVVLYDFMLARGGAESLTLALLEGIPEADLVYGFRDESVFPDSSLKEYRHIDLGAKANFPGWRSVKVMRAFEQRCAFIEKYDWALFSGSNAPLAVRHRAAGKNFYFCHTVPRFAYDLRDYYRQRMHPVLRPALDLLAAYVRHHYEPSILAMDKVISNSENVRARLRKFLNIESSVVYPPIDTERFKWQGQGDYYLSVARLEPFKRVERVIDAFIAMPHKRLIVASGGSELEKLRRRAAGATNIQFTGWLSAERMRDLVGHSIAVVYVAMDEDFGMSPVEAMAAGKPVIGVHEGGLTETVVDGETGVLISGPLDVESLSAAVERLSPSRCEKMRFACEERASKFRREIFLERMREELCI
jgi:glycosyltransferase involved in cell wall biosynthesis